MRVTQPHVVEVRGPGSRTLCCPLSNTTLCPKAMHPIFKKLMASRTFRVAVVLGLTPASKLLSLACIELIVALLLCSHPYHPAGWAEGHRDPDTALFGVYAGLL